MDKFSEMSSKDLVEAYMKVQDSLPNDTQTQEADISTAQINQIKNSVGGEKTYDNIINWASQNLEPNAIEAFDSIVSTGSVEAIQLAISGIKNQYEQANGFEGTMYTGKAASSKDTFRSQAELVQAMSDPRYENDPAYRQDVVDKLDRSDNLQF